MRAAMNLTAAWILCLAISATVRADVLYDTLWIVDSGTMDAGTGNAIGGLNGPTGSILDLQIADDILLDDAYRITIVVTDIMAYNDTVPAEGVWVQIYEHDPSRNKPAEEVFAEQLVARRNLTVEPIESPLRFAAWRIIMDLSAADIVLEPGRWWINCQPLDIETNGVWFWHLGSVSIPIIGEPSHVRDGGVAHGNGYPGLWGSDIWIPHNFRGNNALSMRIEGDPVSDCNPCDMNCDGEVNAFDLESFLDLLFGPNPEPCGACTGDVNGDGIIDAFDIEPFLNCLFP